MPGWPASNCGKHRRARRLCQRLEAAAEVDIGDAGPLAAMMMSILSSAGNRAKEPIEPDWHNAAGSASALVSRGAGYFRGSGCAEQVSIAALTRQRAGSHRRRGTASSCRRREAGCRATALGALRPGPAVGDQLPAVRLAFGAVGQSAIPPRVTRLGSVQ